MRGPSISRLMLRSWLRMLYSKTNGRHLSEVSSMHSKKAGRRGLHTKSLLTKLLKRT